MECGDRAVSGEGGSEIGKYEGCREILGVPHVSPLLRDVGTWTVALLLACEEKQTNTPSLGVVRIYSIAKTA
jgi:hypothetical protein